MKEKTIEQLEKELKPRFDTFAVIAKHGGRLYIAGQFATYGEAESCIKNRKREKGTELVIYKFLEATVNRELA